MIALKKSPVLSLREQKERILLLLCSARAPGLMVEQLSHQYIPLTWCQRLECLPKYFVLCLHIWSSNDQESW